MGIIDGIDTYEKGVAEFVRKTRDKLDKVRPEILFMADADYCTQRSFYFLNGVETEGYGKVEDGIVNWSNLINVHGFWNENACQPSVSYLNHRLPVARWATHRVAFSSAVYTGSAVCQASSPPRNPDGSFGIYDELIKGQAKEAAWLGAPKTPAIHLVLQEEDILQGKAVSNTLLQNIKMKSGTAAIENNALLLQGLDDSDSDSITFIIPGVDLPTHEFTLIIGSSCAAMKKYYPEQARIVTVRPVDRNGNSVLDDHEWWFQHKDRRWGYINDKPYDNYFFFHYVPAQTVDIEICIESKEPVTIESIRLFTAPDAMYRVFENGMVITNPGIHPYTFNLAELSPGNTYRRILGTEYQDRETNNGERVGDKVTIDKHDALFLCRTQ